MWRSGWQSQTETLPSGQDYREQGLKDRLPSMSRPQAIKLLASNGNFIRRPFALSNSFGMLGFKEAEWQEKLNVRQ